MKYILIKILPANYSLATDIVKLIRYHDELIQCTGKYLSKYVEYVIVVPVACNCFLGGAHAQ